MAAPTMRRQPDTMGAMVAYILLCAQVARGRVSSPRTAGEHDAPGSQFGGKQSDDGRGRSEDRGVGADVVGAGSALTCSAMASCLICSLALAKRAAGSWWQLRANQRSKAALNPGRTFLPCALAAAAGRGTIRSSSV